MRKAIAMIELIFAIVVIAISVITIPTMLSISNHANKVMIIDDDALARLSSIMIDKFQARWDGNYSFDDGYAKVINVAISNGVGCIDDNGTQRLINPLSRIHCSDDNATASIIRTPPIADGNVTKGIEQLNGGVEEFEIKSIDGNSEYTVNAEYNVRYVPIETEAGKFVWRLGSSSNLAPNGTTNNSTHVKRLSVKFYDNNDANVTLSFFKSNIGVGND